MFPYLMVHIKKYLYFSRNHYVSFSLISDLIRSSICWSLTWILALGHYSICLILTLFDCFVFLHSFSTKNSMIPTLGSRSSSIFRISKRLYSTFFNKNFMSLFRGPKIWPIPTNLHIFIDMKLAHIFNLVLKSSINIIFIYQKKQYYESRQYFQETLTITLIWVLPA
mgnify:CR=1 FL=1